MNKNNSWTKINLDIIDTMKENTVDEFLSKNMDTLKDTKRASPTSDKSKLLPRDSREEPVTSDNISFGRSLKSHSYHDHQMEFNPFSFAQSKVKNS